MNPMLKAVEIAGSEAELARRTGVSPQAINKAVKKGVASKKLSELIETAVDGAVTRQALVWGEPDQKAA